MGTVIRLLDGLSSLISGLGTDRDKMSTVEYAPNNLSDLEAYNMYEGSATARNVVDFPAIDSCREWRDWQADAAQIELLEEEETRLNLKSKVLRARKWARLFGGCAIFIGTEDTNLMEELNPERVKKQGLKYITVLDRNLITPGEMDQDPASEWYGKPLSYTITSNKGLSLDIHPSRLAIFTGNERPNLMNANVTTQGWGSSVLNATQDAIANADATAANIASLVFEAKVDVISIPDLMNRLRDKRFEAELTQRLNLAMRLKGINGALILDATETYEQKTPKLDGLVDILMGYLQVVAGASRIPATRLLGQAPQGMNATGEGDYKNYLDLIASEQELEMEPAMRRLDECLIRSALGSRPESVYFEWAPVWRQSEKEKSDIFKTKSDAVRVLAGSSPGTELVPIEALSDAIVNTLIEDGSLPGLEQAIKDYGKLSEQEPSLEEQQAALNLKQQAQNNNNPQNKPRKAVNDATPRSLYVYRQVLNSRDIIAWAKSQGFTSTLPADDLHVTVTYSRAAVDWLKMGDAWDDELIIHPGGPRMMERFGKAIVLVFANRSIQWRHQEMLDLGASTDYQDYNPHVTITYEGAPEDLSKVTPFQGTIHLGPEIFEEVREDGNDQA